VMADKGDAPQALVRLSRRRVPVVSVLMSAAAGFLGIIAATKAPQQVFDFLVSSSGALGVMVYMAIIVAQIVLRRRREAHGEPPAPVKMWLFPWLSIIALLGMATVLLAMAFTPSMQTDFKASCITVLVSVVVYGCVRWQRGARAA